MMDFQSVYFVFAVAFLNRVFLIFQRHGRIWQYELDWQMLFGFMHRSPPQIRG